MRLIAPPRADVSERFLADAWLADEAEDMHAACQPAWHIAATATVAMAMVKAGSSAGVSLVPW